VRRRHRRGHPVRDGVNFVGGAFLLPWLPLGLDRGLLLGWARVEEELRVCTALGEPLGLDAKLTRRGAGYC